MINSPNESNRDKISRLAEETIIYLIEQMRKGTMGDAYYDDQGGVKTVVPFSPAIGQLRQLLQPEQPAIESNKISKLQPLTLASIAHEFEEPEDAA